MLLYSTSRNRLYLFVSKIFENTPHIVLYCIEIKFLFIYKNIDKALFYGTCADPDLMPRGSIMFASRVFH